MQCDCVDIGVPRLKQASEIVFRGTVAGFRGDGENRIVIFSVSRVWKGNVGKAFEMQAIESECIGFYPGSLRLGNELLVFASRGKKLYLHPPDTYFSQHCGTRKITLVSDLGALGAGRIPK